MSNGLLILRLTERLRRLADELARPRLDELEMGSAEIELLAALGRSGKPFRMTPSALGRELGLTSGGMTARIDRLEARGLVERIRGGEDRRSLDVALTAAGRKAVAKATAIEDAVGEAIASGLNRRDERELLRLLSAAIAAAESSVEEAAAGIRRRPRTGTGRRRTG